MLQVRITNTTTTQATWTTATGSVPIAAGDTVRAVLSADWSFSQDNANIRFVAPSGRLMPMISSSNNVTSTFAQIRSGMQVEVLFGNGQIFYVEG